MRFSAGLMGRAVVNFFSFCAGFALSGFLMLVAYV